MRGPTQCDVCKGIIAKQKSWFTVRHYDVNKSSPTRLDVCGVECLEVLCKHLFEESVLSAGEAPEDD